MELLFLRCCHIVVPTDAAARLSLKLVLDDLKDDEEEDLRLAKVETELTISGRNVRRLRCFAILQWWSLGINSICKIITLAAQSPFPDPGETEWCRRMIASTKK
jgi:hypothetical protein